MVVSQLISWPFSRKLPKMGAKLFLSDIYIFLTAIYGYLSDLMTESRLSFILEVYR